MEKAAKRLKKAKEMQMKKENSQPQISHIKPNSIFSSVSRETRAKLMDPEIVFLEFLKIFV